MTHREYTRTEKLAVITFVVFLMLIGFCGVVYAADDAGLLENTSLGESLANGSAQTVLSIALLGVSGACVFLAKQLLKTMNARVEDSQVMFREMSTKNTEALTANTEAMRAVKEGYEICKEHNIRG